MMNGLLCFSFTFMIVVCLEGRDNSRQWVWVVGRRQYAAAATNAW
jgi:hypothetical protein